MVPSILVSAARGSKPVIGGAGGELIISAVAQVSLGAPGWNAPSLGGPAVPGGVGEGDWNPPCLPPCVVLSPAGHREQAVAGL